MDAKELAKRMERQRLFWVDLAPGKRVQVLRPLIDDATTFQGTVGITHVCTYVRDWDGIVESDLISGSDSGEAVEFDSKIAALALRDNLDWGLKVAKAIGAAMDARVTQTEAVEKKHETS